MHVQNNKWIKSEGGAIGLFDNKDVLLKRAVSGIIIAEMLRDNNSKLGDATEGIISYITKM